MTTPIWAKPSRMPIIPRVISAAVVIGIIGAAVFTAWDLLRVEQENVVMDPPSAEQLEVETPRAQAEWAVVRANLEARLKQTQPLDLGAVWATRTGQVCGLVNGRGSFGGMSGMKRFYSANRAPVFHQDVDHAAFQYAWFACNRDRWVWLNAGSDEPGFCGTELGKRRCYTVVNGVRRD